MRWVAQPRQETFLKQVMDPNGADEILYGGAAGGGKTEALLIACIIYATQFNTDTLFLRRTFPELEDKPIPRSKELITPDLATYNESKHVWRFKNGRVLRFRSLDKAGDERKFQSSEYGLIAFDELTHFLESQYEYLISRNRTARKGVKPKIISGSNPGNVGHGWVKKRWIEGRIPEVVWEAPRTPEMVRRNLPARKRVFIPARLYDNKILMEADPGYEIRLMSLPENLRRALLEGDWDVFEGQYFSEWRRDKHVIKPFEIPRHWKKFISIDWGYNDPTAVLWFAVGPDSRVFTYREIYKSGVKPSVMAEMIKQKSKDEAIEYVVASPDIWGKHGYEGMEGESIADIFIMHGLPMVKADNNRVNGWMRMREYLADAPDGKPYWQIFETCTELIRTLPTLVYDDKKVEDVSDLCEDHAPESARYGLMTRPSVKGKVSIARDYGGSIVSGGYDMSTVNAVIARLKRETQEEEEADLLWRRY